MAPGLDYCLQRVGHVFQGCDKAILVQKDAYFLGLARYLVLNPVHAGRVRSAGDCPWGSYRPTAGEASALEWLKTRATLAAFADTEPEAVVRYRRFVVPGARVSRPLGIKRKQQDRTPSSTAASGNGFRTSK